MSLAVADGAGRAVLSVDSLVLRPVSAEQIGGARGGRQDSLFRLEWAELARGRDGRAVIGSRLGGARLRGDLELGAVSGVGRWPTYADLPALAAADRGGCGSGLMLVFVSPSRPTGDGGEDVAGAAHRATARGAGADPDLAGR
ncbi:hypothetical protein [Streptomyces sp. Mo3]|uniref:hypothetical protein n=1 Tax=Streptomyces sp. Mo3 TaxID=3161190 RepID=UPI0039EF17FE